MKVRVKLDRHRVNYREPDKLHLMVSLTTPEVEEAKRQPMDVIVALDVSSSMSDPTSDKDGSPSKLALAKEAVRKFVEQLSSRDSVGIVTFSTDVRVVAPLALLDNTHRTNLYEQVSNIHPEGATNLVAGALRGLELMQEFASEGERTRRVILFTDGLPTVGVICHADVMRAIASKLDHGHTPITTFGFGAQVVANGVGSGGYDPELLTSIARASGGNFYHTEGSDGILEAFALELGALRSVAATDVRIKVRPGNRITVSDVLNDFPASTEGDTTVVTIGNMYGDEIQHIVVVLNVPPVDKIFPRNVLATAVEVVGLETPDKPLGLKLHTEFAYVKTDEADSQPDSEVEVQRLRLEAARKIKEAHGRAARGDFQGAVVLIVPLREAAARLGNPDGDTLAKILADIERDLGDRERFSRSSGTIRASSTSMGRGRATSSPYTDDLYRSRAQGHTVSRMTGRKPDPDKDGDPNKN